MIRKREIRRVELNLVWILKTFLQIIFVPFVEQEKMNS
jgi:hypothetical protein